MTPRGTKPGRRELALFLIALALSRLIALAGVAWLVGGREFTDDVWRHAAMARAPFDPFLGRIPADPTQDLSMYPPLMGIFEAALARPLMLVTTDYYAIRLTFLCYEMAAALFFWLALSRLVPHARERLWPMAAFILLPAGWVTSVVMAQDEVIGAAFIAAAFWLFSLGHPLAATVVCALGVTAGKIFLLVPLAALVVMPSAGTGLLGRAVCAAAPVGLVYGWISLVRLAQGSDVPLLGFAPGAGCVVNMWGLLVPGYGVSLETARRISSVLALAFAVTPLAVLAARRREPEPAGMAALISAMLLGVFAVFFHVNAEYFVLALPVLLFSARSVGRTLLLAAVLSLPWAVNFFYGVRNAVSGAAFTPGKSPFAKIYFSVFSTDPSVMHAASLWVSGTALLGLALASIRYAVLARSDRRFHT